MLNLKSLMAFPILLISFNSFSATKCLLTVSDINTGEVVNQKMLYQLRNGLSGQGGEAIYRYKKPSSNESIRLQFGANLGHELATFIAVKYHTKVGTGTLSKKEICKLDLEGGIGNENCQVDHLNINYTCNQIDEGSTYDSQFEVVRELTLEQHDLEEQKKCGLNLDVEFDRLNDTAQSEIMDNVFGALQTNGAQLVTKDEVRSLDLKLKIEKRFLRCRVEMIGSNPADENEVTIENTRSRTCDKAIKKALEKINTCNE